MNMKEANLEAKVDITDDGVIVVFNVIKPLKGQAKEFIKVTITPDRLTAELDENSGFALEKFNYNKIDTEITC